MEDLIFRVDGGVGYIILDREKKLNAQSPEMTLSIAKELRLWQEESNIDRVMIKSSHQRAFCAGADLGYFFKMIQEEDLEKIELFCENEYRLVQQIYHYPKPFEAVIDGLVMGGGVGLAFHGSSVTAAHNFSFAMPEVKIGFFPDVAAVYFLKDLPFNMGKFLAFTGEVIGPLDAYELGLVNQLTFCSQEQPPLKSKYRLIEKLCEGTSFSKIYHRFSQSNDSYIQAVKQRIDRYSFKSMELALAHYHYAQDRSFDEVIEREIKMAKDLIHTPDFKEGIRAFCSKRVPLFSKNLLSL